MDELTGRNKNPLTNSEARERLRKLMNDAKATVPAPHIEWGWRRVTVLWKHITRPRVDSSFLRLE